MRVLIAFFPCQHSASIVRLRGFVRTLFLIPLLLFSSFTSALRHQESCRFQPAHFQIARRWSVVVHRLQPYAFEGLGGLVLVGRASFAAHFAHQRYVMSDCIA